MREPLLEKKKEEEEESKEHKVPPDSTGDGEHPMDVWLSWPLSLT